METRVVVFRVLCWAWSLAHVTSVVLRSWHDESSLRSEAAMLVARICTAPGGYSAGSALIRCDDARAVLAAGPMALIVFERAGVRLVSDTLGAARRELGALLRVLGLAGALVMALLPVADSAACAVTTWSTRRAEQAATSEMRRCKDQSVWTLKED